jgi:hypothetical protein
MMIEEREKGRRRKREKKGGKESFPAFEDQNQNQKSESVAVEIVGFLKLQRKHGFTITAVAATAALVDSR